ncbi:MAG: GDP-mannose 4,6-dehydratase [Balneolaceae bacterium]
MKFLITGAAGFIGSHLTEALLNLNHKVIGLDNFDPFYAKDVKVQNLKHALNNPNFQLLEIDLSNLSSLNSVLNSHEFDAIIHLAAKAGVRNSILKPDEYLNVNVNGTLNLLEAMRKTGHKKLVFASSSSVYGNNKKVPFSETDPVDYPISPYAASKKAAEQLCYTYHHLYDFDIYTLRFFSVYGPRQRPDMGIHKFFNSFLHKKPITMFGDGESRRDYTYISDIIDGTLKAIEHCSGFEIINLGESKTTSLKSLVSQIKNISKGETEVISLPMQPGDVLQTNADILKAEKLLGYSPKVSIQEGLQRQFEYLMKSE